MISFSSFPRGKACELWGAQNAFSSANLGRHVGSLGLGAKPPSPPPHPTPRISGSKRCISLRHSGPLIEAPWGLLWAEEGKIP